MFLNSLCMLKQKHYATSIEQLETTAASSYLTSRYQFISSTPAYSLRCITREMDNEKQNL